MLALAPEFNQSPLTVVRAPLAETGGLPRSPPEKINLSPASHALTAEG
jgi:hypothetical protein